MLLRKINTALPVRQGGLWDVYTKTKVTNILLSATLFDFQ